ncbi:hypothetical protein BDK51DRAFT_38122 [Blyttiomyces helicus]|uniref:Uncharacterized protein n=1 Tax=Blyttiomyces helicus TaxID=388810 RepID=A0A4P9W6U0_9FUNG|nr:hypothetical protein BDK51DRAFT_38122 [Blyttiomyces helicus]|eukprot:RKO86678.1 hypothetical protein BDK51DRAFT_38122 [Blyttiomyces helicus]
MELAPKGMRQYANIWWGGRILGRAERSDTEGAELSLNARPKHLSPGDHSASILKIANRASLLLQLLQDPRPPRRSDGVATLADVLKLGSEPAAEGLPDELFQELFAQVMHTNVSVMMFSCAKLAPGRPRPRRDEDEDAEEAAHQVDDGTLVKIYLLNPGKAATKKATQPSRPLRGGKPLRERRRALRIGWDSHIPATQSANLLTLVRY